MTVIRVTALLNESYSFMDAADGIDYESWSLAGQVAADGGATNVPEIVQNFLPRMFAPPGVGGPTS
ncbi:hypothetical protein GCM10023081_25010 [Arthrobacter ginkgonis]|uniref:Uncharacterized protein n=1 Tax=Arthrobacter ginkgonis TaxID=1630594 RepID=A0ABP7CBV5_9MICC